MHQIINKTVLGALLLVVISSSAYFAGSQQGAKTAANRYEFQIAQMRVEYTQKQIAAETAHAKALNEALEQYQSLSEKMEKINQKHAQTVQQIHHNRIRLKGKIPYAITQDQKTDDCLHGIGIDSLHLYREALGY